jgi:hypothetical protein
VKRPLPVLLGLSGLVYGIRFEPYFAKDFMPRLTPLVLSFLAATSFRIVGTMDAATGGQP